MNRTYKQQRGIRKYCRHILKRRHMLKSHLNLTEAFMKLENT